jgi:hypothetical protein
MYGYTCKVSNQLNITSKSIARVTSSIGTHDPSKSNRDVELVNAFKKNIQYFPSGLGMLFPNLKGINMNSCGLKEVSQDDLRPFSKLSALHLDSNEIQILENGVFDYNPGLTVIDLDSNKLVHIDSNVFMRLTKLVFLGLNLNTCVSDSGNSTSSVQDVINTAVNQCFILEVRTLRNLEAEFTKVTSKTQPEFKDKIEKLEANFRNSNLSQIPGIKHRLEALTEWKSQSLWVLKEQLMSLESTNAEIMKIIKEQNSEIANMSLKYTWMLAVSIFSGIVLIVMLIVMKNRFDA